MTNLIRQETASATDAQPAGAPHQPSWLLLAGGRLHSLMPVAQFNPFERLDKPIMDAGGTDDAYKLWHQLSDERNHYLDGVDDELIRRAKSGTPSP